MQRSTFFIKPEAERFSKQILGLIEASGLRIVRRDRFRLTEKVLRTLYHRLTLDEEHRLIWEQTQQQLIGQEVVMGIVEGEGAIDRLFFLCGESTVPSKCNSKSIRFYFADAIKLQPVSCGKYFYWANGIHRAKTPDEVKRDLGLFFPDELQAVS
ncbi:MAG: nucleoside-diphosphate kinase [Patescibacteria group bacterium]